MQFKQSHGSFIENKRPVGLFVECGAMEEVSPVEMQWKICPAKMYPKKAFFGWTLILFVGLMISSTSILLGVCLTGVLIATQATFLFNSTFTISSKGLVAKYPFRKKQYNWEQVRRVAFFKDVCYLFSRKKPSNMDGWSGIAVIYGDNREDVVSVIKSHLGEDVAK